MKSTLVALFTMSISAVAFAGAMADNTKLDASQTKVDDAAKRVSTLCGGAVVGKIDRTGFMGNDQGIDLAGGYCSGAVEGVSGACDAMPAHKADVVKAVSRVTCHFDATITENHAVKIEKKGTNLDVTINTKSANIPQSVRDYLKKAL